MMIKPINCFVVIAVCLAIPATECQAQKNKLKLPNLLPFKKQNTDVLPYKLSDGVAARMAQQKVGQPGSNFFPQAQSANNKFQFPKLKLFPQQGNAQNGQAKPNPMTDLNNKSKALLSKMDAGLKKFGEDTKKAFSEGWKPPQAKKAWWNKSGQANGQKQPVSPLMNQWLQEQAARQQAQPQSIPRPRVANEYQNGQPRRRF